VRSIYNQAVKKGLCAQRNPFVDVYTGVDKTVKRAVGREVIVALKQANLAGHPELEVARDLFLFSFYLRGISFIDMVHLTTANLRNGYISYVRSKTKQRLTGGDGCFLVIKNERIRVSLFQIPPLRKRRYKVAQK
jgi:hypothetical protein